MSPNNRTLPAGSSREQAASLLPGLAPGSRLLVLRLRSIGDIVLLTPALALLKRWRPDLQISVLVESRFRELLEGQPDVDEILELPPGRGARGSLARVRLLGAIRRRSFALCLNLHGGPTSAWLTAWSGCPLRAGFAHFRQRRAYNVLLPDNQRLMGRAEVHTAELQAAALFWLGLPPAEIPAARITVPPEGAQWWRRRRADLGVTRSYAIIHPTALFATKQWAAEGFAAIGARIEAEAHLPVLYTCGPGETAVLDEVERAAGRRLPRLEGASLGQFSAALAEAELFVGNDSGPAHMARALARPVVVIFGSSSSPIWGPWPAAAHTGAGAAKVVQNPYPCNPCPGDRCYRFAEPECIRSIGTDQVWAAVQEVLAERRAARV